MKLLILYSLISMPSIHSQFDWKTTVFSSGASPFLTPSHPALNENVTIRIRVHSIAPIQQVLLYAAPDGEAWEMALAKSHSDHFFDYYAGSFALHWNTFRYHFILITQDQTVWHYRPHHLQRTPPLLQESFVLLADDHMPTWVQSSVFYHIFPDRFANGDPTLNYRPGEYSFEDWSVTVREWGEPPKSYEQTGNLEFFNGDLKGIHHKLDYLQELGVNAVYLTPIFTSPTNHRYDVQDFYQVDPHLGTESTFCLLRQALHERGMRLIIDGVFNHTGVNHRWFNRGRLHEAPGAYQYEPSPYDDFYLFYDHPDSYESWWGLPSLPKLNFQSQRLRDTIYRKADSVVQYWLEEPRGVDGWRFDVANMTARHRQYQDHLEVWSELRKVIKTRFPHAYLLGEHSQDGTELLQGNCLDGNMNYMGFHVPLFGWLIGSYAPVESQYRAFPNFNGRDFQEQVNRYLYAIPWQVAVMMYNAINTHDRPRFNSMSQHNKVTQMSALVFLFSFVGVPSIYYGDEIGLPGLYDPDNRRCMPWDQTVWDLDLQKQYRTGIQLRKQSQTLSQGSFCWLFAEESVVAYARFDQEGVFVSVMVKTPPQQPIAISMYALGIAQGQAHSVFRGTAHRVSDFCLEVPPVADIYQIH